MKGRDGILKKPMVIRTGPFSLQIHSHARIRDHSGLMRISDTVDISTVIESRPIGHLLESGKHARVGC